MTAKLGPATDSYTYPGTSNQLSMINLAVGRDHPLRLRQRRPPDRRYNQATGTLIREYVWNGWEPVAVIEG